MLAVLAHFTPVTALLASRSHDEFTRAHGRAALRFQLSLVVYVAAIVGTMHALAGTVAGVQFVPFLFFLNLMLVLNWLLFAVVGMRRAVTGQTFTYPLTLGRT